MKKRFCSIIMMCVMVMSLSVPVFAAQPIDLADFAAKNDSAMSVSEINRYKNAFDTMTDDEFDRAIITMVKETEDIELLRNNLSNCGVELNEVTIKKHYRTRALDSDDAEIVLTSAKRTGQSYYHLVVGLEFSSYETYATTQDGLSLYFDSRKADYVGYNTSTANGFRLKSGQQATNGTLVFNFNDSLVNIAGYNDSFYTAVYVEPHDDVTTPIVFGADYAHTYGEVDLQITGGSIGFNFGPVSSGSVSVNFAVTYDDERMWQIAALSDF